MADKILDTNIQSSQFQNSNDLERRYSQTEDVIDEIETVDIPTLERMYNTKMKFIQQDQPALENEIQGMGWFKLV